MITKERIARVVECGKCIAIGRKKIKNDCLHMIKRRGWLVILYAIAGKCKRG